MEYQVLDHEFPPVWDENSRVLILGSFPSVKSRAEGFFYGHPRNRFWKVMAAVLSASEPVTVEEKKKFLLEHRIALWDVVGSCRIRGSSDSSIRDVVPNDIGGVLSLTKIQNIFANGSTAGRLYGKYIYPETHIPAVVLPSTSPANAAWNLGRLIEEYRQICYIL